MKLCVQQQKVHFLTARLVKAVDSTTWAINRVLEKKTRGRGRVEEYLVKWEGFGPEYNRWILNYLINTLKITFLT